MSFISLQASLRYNLSQAVQITETHTAYSSLLLVAAARGMSGEFRPGSSIDGPLHVRGNAVDLTKSVNASIGRFSRCRPYRQMEALP